MSVVGTLKLILDEGNFPIGWRLSDNIGPKLLDGLFCSNQFQGRINLERR